MKAEIFYQQIVEYAARPPNERHALIAQLHTEVMAEYLTAIRAITPEKAVRLVAIGSETRTLAQVVGHIAEWERFIILAAGDILAGIQHPRMVTSLEGYIEPNSDMPTFANIDAFNEYQAAKYASWSWAQTQELAIDTATTLHILFTHPRLLSPERLERTKRFRKRLQNGIMINDIAMGWNLWITTLEHEGVEHTLDLEMSH